MHLKTNRLEHIIKTKGFGAYAAPLIQKNDKKKRGIKSPSPVRLAAGVIRDEHDALLSLSLPDHTYIVNDFRYDCKSNVCQRIILYVLKVIVFPCLQGKFSFS